MQHEPRTRPAHPGRWALAAFLYAALVAYGSLFPLSGWTEPASLWAWLSAPLAGAGRQRLSWPDLVVNVLAYVPLGLALAMLLGGRRRRLAAVPGAALLGTGLSLAIETLQTYLPARVPALSDLVTNCAGSLLGAFAAGLLDGQGALGQRARRWRERWIVPGRRADLGLLALGLWAMSQLSPFVPSFDLGKLRQGLAPIARVFGGQAGFNLAQALEYLCFAAAVALLAGAIVRAERARWRLVLVFLGAVLVLKVPIVSRQLSLEALSGVAAGLALVLGVLGRLRPAAAAAAGLAFVLAGACTEALRPGETGDLAAFNWIPFKAHLVNPLIGIDVILDSAWLALALAWFAAAAGLPIARAGAAVLGAAVVGGGVFALEYLQRGIPGRVGDVTPAVIVAVLWLAACWQLRQAPAAAAPSPGLPEMSPDAPPDAPSDAPSDAPRRRRRRSRSHAKGRGRRRWLEGLAGAGGVLVLGTSVVWAVTRPRTEGKVDKRQAAKLPAPAELPRVALPGFRQAHPRLPFPAPDELEALRRLNPGYVREREREAAGGRGSVHAAALTELLSPGSQDLGVLAQRLVERKFSWRGHEPGRDLALAYDWLHDRWTLKQREALRDKLVEGCEYLIGYIREERLSPYNVYLYNAPFQALVACTLALYGDDPRGEAVMAFTHDLWKSRVLPVWRQIMGRNGGWHEGGEYVGIGIGQAVYQVPAMWRRATGEDLFASEPGLRGFLDFLVHRTLPDGSHMRWGDGGYFDRIIPDVSALAMEFRHAAAYSLRPPVRSRPTAWPWGPLADDRLLDPAAAAALPRSLLCDGIGMLLVRNRWSKDATHVAFKAGDNYWSHVHLDQGAFTIHRGGAALAIDSGFYREYGSDHHLNYHYQTVAHNVVTVTDPDDTVPAPARNDKEAPRPIANDGGQRRIGSGWGVERGPLDIDEWRAKHSIYHTGRIVRHLGADGVEAALADITPAYTNELSGKGTFSHRTRRVERYWRFLGYDTRDDFVVVYDDVRASRAEFRKRWLLHTLQAPQIEGQRFVVRVPAQPALQREGGELEGHVLLPAGAVINAVGGPGLEFFVDGRNFDDEGKLAERWRQRERDPARPEPGAWRIELMPERDQADDQFLVVLVPGASGAARPHQVRRLPGAGAEVGVEVATPTRTTRWWFSPGRLGARIELLAPGSDTVLRTHTLQPG